MRQDLNNKLFSEIDLPAELEAIQTRLATEPPVPYRENSLRTQYSELCKERDNLILSQEYYKNMFDYAPIAFFCLNEYGVFTDINFTCLELFGFEYQELIRQPVILRIASTSRRRFLSHIQRVRTGESDTVEVDIDSKNGLVPVLLKSVPASREFGLDFHCQCAAIDISQRKKAEEELNQTKDDLAHLAHHDALTGLPNRLLFQDRLRQALLRTERSGNMGALAFLDLDHFKNINDSLGHQVGDEILCQVAQRLSGSIRHEDTVCRIGGDEFTIILENVCSITDVAHIAGKLIEVFQKPFQVYSNELYLKTSIGISLFPQDGSNVQEIIKSADIAMYETKAEGRNNFKLYDEKMRSRVNNRVGLENGLFKAVENNELVLHYQPIYSVDGMQIEAVEALLRWKKTENEIAYPDEFIPIAEETDLINEIGDWVIRHACLQISDWRKQGLGIEKVAINISPRQLNHKDFIPNVKNMLLEANLPASCIEFELTEGAMMTDTVAAVALFDELMKMGITISVDDFGTGYSSLGHIKRFPVKRLKIDASFIRSIPNDKNDCAIASAIISMAQRLDLQVVSEGIENAEQLEYLKGQGCLLYQGNYLSEALSAEQLEQKLSTPKGITIHQDTA